MVGLWLRAWRRKPLLLIQFALTVALGMGAVAAVASLMLALGYQPLPFRDPSQLVAVWERVEGGASRAGISGPDLVDLARGATGAFTNLGAFGLPRYWLLDSRRGAEQIVACYIETETFRDLGIRPALGRNVTADDVPAGTDAMAPVWISSRLWHDRYGDSPSVIGLRINLASNAAGLYESPYQIAGVLPPDASIPIAPGTDHTDVWMILSSSLKANRPRGAGLFFGLGRLRPGISVSQGQAALTEVAQRLGEQYPFDSRKRPVLESLESIAQGPARRTIGLLTLGVALVFLLACANLAILMVVEGSRRRRELAIRAALGAGRWRLWGAVVAEYAALTVFSLILGVWCAVLMLRVLARLVPAAGLGLPLVSSPPLNLGVLLGCSVFALVAAAVWSALLVAAADRRRTAEWLAAGGRPGFAGVSDSDRGAARLRLVLVSIQAAIGICLVSTAALAAETYARLSAANLGPAPATTALLSVRPRDAIRPTDAEAVAFNTDVMSRLSRLPGVQTVALTDNFPPTASPMSFRKEGDSADVTRETTSPVAVSDDYFHALGIPVLFGGGFDKTVRADSEPEAIINLEMAARNWTRPEGAVGAEIEFGSAFQNRYRIAGVVGNFTGYWSDTAVPTIYLPEAQAPSWGGEMIVRTGDTINDVPALARQAPEGMAFAAEISDASTMQSRWQKTVTRPKARMTGMLLLALLALGLSIQGVYAAAAATVAARGHELAVRSALGASAGWLAWGVTRALVLAALSGATLGVVAVIDLRPVVDGWLGSAATSGDASIAVAVAFLVVVAAMGCYIPSRAAARANPADALRLG